MNIPPTISVHLDHAASYRQQLFHQMSSLANENGPSTASIALATAILSVATGYLIGSASSIGIFGSSGRNKKAPTKSWPNSYDVTIHPDSSDEELMEQLGRKKGKEVKDSEDEDEADSSDDEQITGELASYEGNKEECKLVLVVRTDLGMSKGNFQLCCIRRDNLWKDLFQSQQADKIATHRQDSSSSISCNTSLLYDSSFFEPQSPCPPPLEIVWSGQDCRASPFGRGVAPSPGQSHESWFMRQHNS